MANFDLTNLAIQALCPNNEILYDDKGRPSIMVKLAKKTYAELGLGDSTATFPAWIVNNAEVDHIWISKYPNIVKDSRAYSLPCKDPANNISWTASKAACEAKGAGWHLMTAYEWGAIIRQVALLGVTPKGNNSNGKHDTESAYQAIPAARSDGAITRTMTGTGPLTWSHDGTPSGIFDLCGNVWEWTGGIRQVYGEIQILANNNAADADNSQDADSALWMAIDATTGGLITPDGSGTTENSVKLQQAVSSYTYKTTVSKSTTTRYPSFKNGSCDETISDAAKAVLIALGLLPADPDEFDYNQQLAIQNGNAERMFARGGCYATSSAHYGFPSFCSSNNSRSNTDAHFGFRSAYVELPSAS